MKNPAQESDTVPVREIAIVGAGVVVVTVLAVLVARGLAGDTPLSAGAIDRAPPPAPDVSHMERSLFAAESQGFADHARDDVHLSSYGWIDRERGIVHVPIDVAIEIYLARRGDR